MMLLKYQLDFHEWTWESLPRGSALFFAIGFEDDLRLPILNAEVSTTQDDSETGETCRKSKLVVVLRNIPKERATWKDVWKYALRFQSKPPGIYAPPLSTQQSTMVDVSLSNLIDQNETERRVQVKTGWAFFVCVCVYVLNLKEAIDGSKLGRFSFTYPLAFLVFSLINLSFTFTFTLTMSYLSIDIRL